MSDEYVTSADSIVNYFNAMSIRDMLAEVRANERAKNRLILRRTTQYYPGDLITEMLQEVRANHNGQSRFHKTVSRFKEGISALFQTQK